MFTNVNLPIVITLAVTAVIYFFVSQCVRVWEERQKLRKLSWFRYLDPVVLSSGPNGEGSISRLQILFFSFLVFALVLHFFLMAGQLTDLSESVLTLLGISGGSAALAKVADTQKERLGFENWAWLIERKWLPKKGVAATTVASWTDIVTSADGVDVYRVQMLIFSLLVGMGLIKAGGAHLAEFVIPNSLLQLLGLSQVVYLGGKMVGTTGHKELNDALTDLRERESAFMIAAAKSDDGAPTPPEAHSDAAKPLASSDAEGEKVAYNAYLNQCAIVKKMFESVLGPIAPEAIFEPKFPKDAPGGGR